MQNKLLCSQMDEFSHHEPCPNCGSRDNLGVWQDGHKFCFGCGYHVSAFKEMSRDDIRHHIKHVENKEKKNRVVVLPSDFTTAIPSEPKEWLTKYGVTDAEIKTLQIGWSNDNSAIVLPAFDIYGNLLVFQFRYFPARHPKYWTFGNPTEILFGLGTPVGGRLCVVEDYISAIRVGRYVECSPLWGSNLSLIQIKRISDHWERLILWLDYDKTGHALKLKMKALPYFKSVSIISTKEDPKELSDAQIAEQLAPLLN